MEPKLYVGNLPYSTTEDDLRTLFAQAGTVASAEVIKDRISGQSKGFAFVLMGSQSEAEKAISMFNGYKIEERDLRVSIARPREESDRGGFGPRRDSRFDRGRGGRDQRGNKGSGPRRY
ncbi:MAG: RNA-binding protein [Anaerolineales bacterium]|nr:RNA-binding protein [Anaerolineales bacterium]